MTEPNQSNENGTDGKGPKYSISIEGRDYPWDKNTITVADICNLAGWSTNQSIVEVNLKDNSEVTLADNAIIEIKPGRGFSKKIEFASGTIKPPRAHAQ